MEYLKLNIEIVDDPKGLREHEKQKRKLKAAKKRAELEKLEDRWEGQK